MLRVLAGVPEQAPDLGVRTVAAHWPGHGHREHPALCRLQQTEHNTRRESGVWPTHSMSPSLFFSAVSWAVKECIDICKYQAVSGTNIAKNFFHVLYVSL